MGNAVRCVKMQAQVFESVNWEVMTLRVNYWLTAGSNGENTQHCRMSAEDKPKLPQCSSNAAV